MDVIVQLEESLAGVAAKLSPLLDLGAEKEHVGEDPVIEFCNAWLDFAGAARKMVPRKMEQLQPSTVRKLPLNVLSRTSSTSSVVAEDPEVPITSAVSSAKFRTRNGHVRFPGLKTGSPESGDGGANFWRRQVLPEECTGERVRERGVDALAALGLTQLEACPYESELVSAADERTLRQSWNFTGIGVSSLPTNLSYAQAWRAGAHGCICRFDPGSNLPRTIVYLLLDGTVGGTVGGKGGIGGEEFLRLQRYRAEVCGRAASLAAWTGEVLRTYSLMELAHAYWDGRNRSITLSRDATDSARLLDLPAVFFDAMRVCVERALAQALVRRWKLRRAVRAALLAQEDRMHAMRRLLGMLKRVGEGV